MCLKYNVIGISHLTTQIVRRISECFWVGDTLSFSIDDRKIPCSLSHLMSSELVGMLSNLQMLCNFQTTNTIANVAYKSVNSEQ